MKPRQKDKLLKYIQRDNFPRFKSYFKKHDVNPNERLEEENTLLHLACRMGTDAIVRYLLKKGADPLLVNPDGDLPLHLAAKFALAGNKHAYTDLILPLIQRSPSSQDLPNAEGKTARGLLAGLAVNVHDVVESEEEDAEEKEADSWRRRLEEELGGDCSQAWGRYDDTYNGSAETWNQWADRIHQEHQTRNHWSYPARTKLQPHPKPTAKRRQPHQYSESIGPKRPKISNSHKEAFARNLMKETEADKAKIKLQQAETYNQRIAEYETLCRCLFKETGHEQSPKLKTENQIVSRRLSAIKNEGGLLEYHDISWPMFDMFGRYPIEVSSEKVLEFLFGGLERKSKEYSTYLKTQQRRWHPDRFQQKCGSRIADSDKEIVLNTVTQLSQILNKLLET